MSNLLIIESPGKIKKLRQILGADWTIQASMGHIRQLAKDGEDSLGFDLTGNTVSCRFAPKDSRASSTIKKLQAAVRQADTVYLATDPDREGETIGWHIAQALSLKNPRRVVYSEITASAVERAIASPRQLNMHLVNAGLARSCLDKLVGFRGSPLVWSLNRGAKSIGRVQSATLHILCQREREIQNFKPVDYWSVFVDYQEGFRAFYLGKNARDESSTDAHDDGDAYDVNEGKTKTPESTKVLSLEEAERLVEIAKIHPHRVVQVEGKITQQKPPAPFTTSTLQQAAGSRLKFSPERTMKIAQSLYEKGLITYMRTDSVNLSPEFCATVRRWLQEKDPDNVPDKVAIHRSAKNSQEAHEAIRPTDITRSSKSLKEELSAEEFDLYLMIWMRTVASQCQSARIRKMLIVTQSGSVYWQARGQVIEFQGYAKYWKNKNEDSSLPTVVEGQVLTLNKANHEQKQTQPPPRLSEPVLVSVMEKRGIGRPSTYAPTIATLKEREYARVLKGKLQPTELGLTVDSFLLQALPNLLKADFTAEMENRLDAIAEGKEDWQRYLTTWNHDYFAPALERARALISATPELQAKEREKSDLCCPQCQIPMSIIPSASKKLAKPYFLKCDRCEGVQFFNPKTQIWDSPKDKNSQPLPLQLTNYPCPVCGSPLACHEYLKDGQTKTRLTCSQESGDKNRHKDVVYFESRGGYWSRKFGELVLSTPGQPQL